MIRLRIAGIYYDELFDINLLTPAFSIPDRVPPTSGQPTIFELLEAAYRKPGRNKENFVYVFERRGLAVLRVPERRFRIAAFPGQRQWVLAGEGRWKWFYRLRSVYSERRRRSNLAAGGHFA